MNKEQIITEEAKTLVDLEMRNTNGLTRRTFANQEDGINLKDNEENEMKLKELPISKFRDTVIIINNISSIIFIIAVIITGLVCIYAGKYLHQQNTILNFFYVWGSIILFILSIMGLMNALKVDK